MDPPLAHYSTIRQQMSSILSALASQSMNIICHLPTFVSTADLTDSIREASLLEMFNSLEVAAELGSQKVVLHPGHIGGLGIYVEQTALAHANNSLAAIIDQINSTRLEHIITIEDPIEFLHRDKKSIVNQREVDVDTRGFAPAMRVALRQDPDVILVGEMRDYETIETALLAAETGHLVMSTLHTLDATETINRIISVFPPHQQKQIRIQLAAVLKAAISLRLVPRA
ncbi:MAG: ATPase, T2SS/T4P/T4SS family, partial [Gemmatimonadales bacterium]